MPHPVLSLLADKLRRRVTISYTSANNHVHHFKIAKNKSVLDGLIDAGAELDYSCKAGLCQSCLVQSEEPEAVPVSAQRGLNDAERSLGYFLPCLCQAEKSLSIRAVNTVKPRAEAEIISVQLLEQQVLVVKLRAPFSFQAGQFCNIYKADNNYRSYSIASESNSKTLEFHIKVIENGFVSSWAKNTFKPGGVVEIQGPYGKCIYTEALREKNKPLLLCGIGTGLAPLLGVLKDALHSGHSAPINLVLGARSPQSFYLQDELEEIEKRHDNLSVTWLSSEGADRHISARQADIYAHVKAHYPNLSDYAIFLCGAESFVKKMKKTCYLNDADLSQILNDAFVAGGSND